MNNYHTFDIRKGNMVTKLKKIFQLLTSSAEVHQAKENNLKGDIGQAYANYAHPQKTV